jgi:hypothetical protein
MPAGLSGLSVLTPAAWWALLTLAIPLLIHLFSRSRGRLVRIGHIDLIRKARQLQVTEIKLTQWLLLLLRLAIFALASLILVGLATKGLDSSDTPTIYVTPGWLHNSTLEDIDSLLSDADLESRGRIYLLRPGFPAADREQLITGRQKSLTGAGDYTNVWALLSERLSLENHRGRVMVYATDYMLQYGSRRPALPREVEWRVSQPGQSLQNDTEAPRVLITHDADRAADAELIISVLSVLKEHRLPGLLWERLESSRLGEAPLKSDWLIHLGSDALNTTQIEALGWPSVALTDTGGNSTEDTSQFVSLPFYPFTNFRVDRFTRHTRDDPRNPMPANTNVLLTSSDGSPLLQESQFGQTRLMQFNSRFNPAWNSLTLQPEFPELLLQLLSGNTRETLRFSDARIDTVNLPGKTDEPVSDIPLPHRSLQGFLAVLLALLWVCERWLSERISRDKR